MKQMTASAFKAKCLQLMDEVAATGEPVIITKNGHPICQLVPYRRKPKTLYGALQGSIRSTGDLIARSMRGRARCSGTMRATERGHDTGHPWLPDQGSDGGGTRRVCRSHRDVLTQNQVIHQRFGVAA
jgi:prevent-host-death family protein